MKSLSDCLIFIESMIIYNIEKRDSMKNLEGVREYFLDRYNDKNNQELVPMLPVLYQINLIIDRFYIPNDYDITIFLEFEMYIELFEK